ncbi:hypothetical protein [Rahnella aceris]
MTIYVKKTTDAESKPILNNIFAKWLRLTIVLSGLLLWISTKTWRNDVVYSFLNLATYIAVPILMWLDSKELKKAGFARPSWWWVLCYPGWILRRTKHNPNKKLRNSTIFACVFYLIMLVLVTVMTAQHMRQDPLTGSYSARIIAQPTEKDGYPSLTAQQKRSVTVAQNENTDARDDVAPQETNNVLSGRYNTHTAPDTLPAEPAQQVEQNTTKDSLRQALYRRGGKPVFYAQTTDHKKEVQICIVTPSVSYSFGKIGDPNKEMDISIPAGNSTYAAQTMQSASIYEFAVRTGDTRYEVSSGTNDAGEPWASLDVYKGAPETGKHLATIKLAPETVVNNISDELQNEGIKISDDL